MGLWGRPFSFAFKDNRGPAVHPGDHEPLAEECGQEAGRDGQDGNDNERCEQGFGPWWIMSAHFTGLRRKGRKGERVQVV